MASLKPVLDIFPGEIDVVLDQVLVQIDDWVRVARIIKVTRAGRLFGVLGDRLGPAALFQSRSG